MARFAVVKGGKVLSHFGSRLAWRSICVVSLCACIGTLAGCGDSSSNLLPVSGKVTVDGQPLTTGSVSFRPEKGSASSQEPGGDIDEEGEYHVFTAGKEGAPPGRYRVLVVAVDPNDLKKKFPYGKRTSFVNPKYSDPKKTDLVIEVSPSPAAGAYDLKLTK
jgi:hypothetical protein